MRVKVGVMPIFCSWAARRACLVKRGSIVFLDRAVLEFDVHMFDLKDLAIASLKLKLFTERQGIIKKTYVG